MPTPLASTSTGIMCSGQRMGLRRHHSGPRLSAASRLRQSPIWQRNTPVPSRPFSVRALRRAGPPLVSSSTGARQHWRPLRATPQSRPAALAGPGRPPCPLYARSESQARQTKWKPTSPRAGTACPTAAQASTPVPESMSICSQMPSSRAKRQGIRQTTSSSGFPTPIT